MGYYHYFALCLAVFLILATCSSSDKSGDEDKHEKKSEPEIFCGAYILWKTNDCSKSLDIYKTNTDGKRQGKIINSSSNVDTTNRIVKIDWKADIKNVKGFKILLKSTGKPDLCRILDYTDTIKNYPLGVYLFSFTLTHLYSNVYFTAELSPLPNMDTSSVVTLKFNTVGCSFFWPIFTQVYDGRYLNIIFTKGPDKCSYKSYEIVVYKNKTDKIITKMIVPTQDNVDKLQSIFELNICRGVYYITVGVYKEKAHSCPCKYPNNSCSPCQAISSSPLYFIPARRCSPALETPKKPEETYKLHIYFGIVIGALFLTLLALSIVHWVSSAHRMTPNRGIVLFLDDHKPHTNAVTKLVQYLNECHLRVSLASAFLQNPDIPNQLVVMTEALKSDFILLILSNTLQKRMEAWDKQQDYVEFFKEVNSNILTKQFLEILMASNKLNVCKFDHVAGFGHWPKPCYSLPTDLNRMTTDLSGRSRSQRMILCKSWKSHSLSIELHKEIQKAILYEQSHENCFLEKYVCPRNVADSYIAVDETSRTESFVSSPKLKEIYNFYRDKFTESKAHPIITESIDSEGVSLNLEEINACNLQL